MNIVFLQLAIFKKPTFYIVCILKVPALEVLEDIKAKEIRGTLKKVQRIAGAVSV